jgi:hypothetical protein
MEPAENISQESELVIRRLLEGLPVWGLFFPVVFAFLVLFLVLFFRQQDTVGDMLKRARIPGLLTGLLGLFWTAGLFIYIALLLALPLAFGVEPPAALVLLGGIPLAAFPLLLGLFIAVMICIRDLKALLAVAGVTAGCAVYLLVGALFRPVFGWYVVLVPVLGVALFYVGCMYVRDAHTIHPAWAAFLGLCRCIVYCTLAAVFLLPGCQTYQTTETHSKVLVLFDVSGSMNLVDDNPAPGQDPRTLLSRQGKVLQFLTAGGDGHAFMDRVQQKSPASVYRFGGVLDDVEVQQFLGERRWDKDQWYAWLHPDRNKVKVPAEVGGKKLTEEERTKLRVKLSGLYEDLVTGTNVSGSALHAAMREAGSQLQAVIIISDGRSNQGSGETFREFRDRATNPKRPFHVITVGVGDYRQPVGIRIMDLGAPQQARPDDKFPVRVPVIGDGLRGEPFTVTLEGNRVTKKGDRWEPIPGDKITLTKDGKFEKGDGEHPFGEVEFEIDIRALRGIKQGDETKDDQVEGTWEFRARVPRHRLESFPDPEHVSKRPARVVVQKRKLRVLLFAGGPSRDYQFLRTLFYREVQEKRLELSIYLQTAAERDVDQDVESERLLLHFPDRLGGDDPKAKPGNNLNDFDVIVAFDPDWDKVDAQQMKNLEKWVQGQSAGGFIFVAGPVNSYQLARGRKEEMAPLLTIMPVTLKDSRLHSLGIDHDAKRPYALNFPERAKQIDFLHIDEEALKDKKGDENPLVGWEQFFWGDGPRGEPGKDTPPRHGFYNYYPVEKVKPGSEVLATFAGPAASRINDSKDEQPYFVSMPYGAGRTFYISSAETWRLRQYNQTYHQRFWIKLLRYVSSGNLSKLSRYGMIPIATHFPAGLIKVEAQLRGADLNPLPRDFRPVVKLIRPATFDPKTDRDTPEQFELKAKPSQTEWQGYFAGNVRINTPGDYRLKIPIPGTAQSVEHDFTVVRPDPETEITRPDHGHLYQLATSARPVLNRLHEKERRELMKVLHAPAGTDKDAKEPGGSGKDEARLYFPLAQAHVIPDLLLNVPPSKESTKGRLQDLWDRGVETGLSLPADVFIMILVGAVGLLGFAVLLFIRRWVLALLFLGGAGLVVIGVLLVDLLAEPRWANLPLDMSFVLGLVVGLLAVEWLTRKLLKLA